MYQELRIKKRKVKIALTLHNEDREVFRDNMIFETGLKKQPPGVPAGRKRHFKEKELFSEALMPDKALFCSLEHCS